MFSPNCSFENMHKKLMQENGTEKLDFLCPTKEFYPLQVIRERICICIIQCAFSVSNDSTN